MTDDRELVPHPRPLARRRPDGDARSRRRRGRQRHLPATTATRLAPRLEAPTMTTNIKIARGPGRRAGRGRRRLQPAAGGSHRSRRSVVDSTPSASPRHRPPRRPRPDGRPSRPPRDYVVRAFAGDRWRSPDGPGGLDGLRRLVASTGQPAAASRTGSASPSSTARMWSSTHARAAQQPSPAPSPPSVDGLVASLFARQDLHVSGVTDITLAGYSGKRLDLELPAALACGSTTSSPSLRASTPGSSNRWRVWVLDADGETAILVLMDYAATPAADRAAAQTILDSLRISP